MHHKQGNFAFDSKNKLSWLWMFLWMLSSFAPPQQHSQDWSSYMGVWKVLVFIPAQPGLANIDNSVQCSINCVYCCWNKVIPLLAVKQVWFVNRSLGAVLWLQIQRGFDRNTAELDYICVGVREQNSPVKMQTLPARATALDETLQKADTVQNGSCTVISSHAY